MFGGATGPFRLLQSGLGDQAGWLLGFAVVAGLALLFTTRLRRRDPSTGFLLVIGGAFVCSAVAFSFAQGIFHPYYVSLLAPFGAAFIGAGVGQMLSRERDARIVGPLALLGGVVTEVIVLGELGGGLPWAVPLVIAVCGLCGVALMAGLAPRTRAIVVSVALAALLAAPATWAAETLGHATNGTFPTGGPASASIGGPGGPGGLGGRGGPWWPWRPPERRPTGRLCSGGRRARRFGSGGGWWPSRRRSGRRLVQAGSAAMTPH